MRVVWVSYWHDRPHQDDWWLWPVWNNNSWTRNTLVFLMMLGVSGVGLLECKTPTEFNQTESVPHPTTTLNLQPGVCRGVWVGLLNPFTVYPSNCHHEPRVSLHVCTSFSLPTVSGGVGSGEGAGDEEVGSVRNPGQWGDLPQPPGGPTDSMCNL